ERRNAAGKERRQRRRLRGKGRRPLSPPQQTETRSAVRLRHLRYAGGRNSTLRTYSKKLKEGWDAEMEALEESKLARNTAVPVQLTGQRQGRPILADYRQHIASA